MKAFFKNPVWPHYFADPFVLRWRGEYFAYGTGEKPHRSSDGRVFAFQVLRSKNLFEWESAGGALELKGAERAQAFWAPEVAMRREDEFFLYFSSAPKERDELHRLRVATATAPTGPFVERGTVFPADEGFCIDAHPFRDPRDGQWYLFFAKDFFDEPTGTGVAVVRLSGNMREAAGATRVVVRANADWQIYQRKRFHYGREWNAWHTVEGPCVVFHDGRYYCFYSGGNWQTHDYGVSYAVANHPLGPWKHPEEAGPIVLRQRPGEVLGPGHNCHIVGPDDRTEFLVYHAWDPRRTARRMCVERLVWASAGPRCEGVTAADSILSPAVGTASEDIPSTQ